MKFKFLLTLGLLGTVTGAVPIYANVTDTKPDVTPVINMPNAFTSDSERIIFQSHERTTTGGLKTELLSMNLDGSDIKKEVLAGANPGWPEFTKDGKRAAYFAMVNGNFDLLVADLSQANNLSEYVNVKRITHHPKEDFFISWSPDEQRIVFYSHRDDSAQIYVMNADGGGIKNLSNNQANETDPDWSIQGHITFQSDLAGNNDVWVMNSHGKHRQNLTNHPAQEYFGDWSPDGEHLVFSSDRDGDQDLYIMKKDGSDLRQLTNKAGTDRWPLWSPDGKTITFSRVVDKWSNVFTISPNGENEVQLTENRSYH